MVSCFQDFDHGHGVRQHRGVQHRFQSLALRASEPLLRRQECTAGGVSVQRGTVTPQSREVLQWFGQHLHGEDDKEQSVLTSTCCPFLCSLNNPNILWVSPDHRPDAAGLTCCGRGDTEIHLGSKTRNDPV